ncbi:MAG: signal peptidase I, partial [Anaerolineaceae bacterium]
AEPAAAVVEEAAPAFEFVPPAEVESEPVADENPWKWPAEPAAVVVEDAVPAFEAVPSAEVESEPLAEENSWKWPAEPANVVVEEAVAAFEVVPPEAAWEPVAEEDGWDPEPFDAPVLLRRGFAFAPALSDPADGEPVEEFSFSFEPESADEERFAAPSAWVEPVALVAPEAGDEERPWWEADDEGEPTQPVSTSPEVYTAERPDAMEVPLAAMPLPPTLTPTADEDPWDEVASIDSGVPEVTVADSSPPTGQSEDDAWEQFTPPVIAPNPVTSLASIAEERTFTFDSPSPAQEAGESAGAHERSWIISGDGARADAGAAAIEAALPEPDVDHLAASLESQMAVAEDERLTRGRWDTAAFAAEDEPPRHGAGAAPYEHDDDVVLRAFNAHAASPDPEPAPIDREQQRAEDAAFNELLGAGAADIVAEAADEQEPARSFLSPVSWSAPQRDTPENPFDAPWEHDEGESPPFHSPAADLRPAIGPGSGTDVPWGGEYDYDNDGGAPVVGSHTRHDRTKTVVREVVETVMLALLVFLCVRASFQNFKVDGSSMYPTLENGQFLIVNKLVYSEVDMEKLSNFIPLINASSGEKRNVFHGPARGDIVVLQDPRKPETDLIKRVIGLPGETLEIVDGKVYINDFRLDEPYIKTVWHDNKPKILVPAGQYFVMGDNRDNSLDSRSQPVGFVPKDLIIGKTMVSYWPRSKFGLAPNEAGNISTKDGVPRLTTQTVDEARMTR